MRKLDRPYTDPSYLFRHGGAAAPGLLDFSASINPLGPSPLVLQAIRDALPTIARYPDPECRELTALLAKQHNVAPEQIVVGNGSNDLIYAIARAFRPKRVAIAEPTYTEYLRASLLVGAEVDHWLAEGGDFQLSTFDPAGADVVWMCNPNNPTGSMWGRAAHLAKWMQAHPASLFVVDETFLQLCPDEFMLHRGPSATMLAHLHEVNNLLVVCSFTKFFAFPGLRLGYLVTSPRLAEQVRAEVVPWSVNRLAAVAGVAALRDGGFQSRTQSWLAEHWDRFDGLGTLRPQCNPLPSTTIFQLVRLRNMTSTDLCARLAERGIAIRDASNFVGLDERYVRIAVRLPQENQRLLTELKSILES